MCMYSYIDTLNLLTTSPPIAQFPRCPRKSLTKASPHSNPWPGKKKTAAQVTTWLHIMDLVPTPYNVYVVDWLTSHYMYYVSTVLLSLPILSIGVAYSFLTHTSMHSVVSMLLLFPWQVSTKSVYKTQCTCNCFCLFDKANNYLMRKGYTVNTKKLDILFIQISLPTIDVINA